MSKLLYFDCFAGISGDMTVGALLDLGIDAQELESGLRELGLEGWSIQVKRGRKNGISGTDFYVLLDSSTALASSQAPHHHHPAQRNLYDIEAVIDGSSLNDNIKACSKAIFQELALAESKVHGSPVSHIHFHEVGALDSIIDIVGTAICLDILGVDEIYSSPLNLGRGFVECAHGILPVPAPATMEILKEVPVYSSGLETELVTPTGAAIVKTLAREFIPMPEFTLDRTGYGLGKKDLEIPNVLRVVLARRKSEAGYVLLETNIDDMNPEYYSYLFPLLLNNGARDVYLSSIVMKKNRPGTLVSVLCRNADARRLQDLLFAETSTLGIRKIPVERTELERKIMEVNTRLGPVQVKVAYQEGRVLKFSPEYEECQRVAKENKIPLRDVYEIVMSDAATLIRGPEPTLN